MLQILTPALVSMLIIASPSAASAPTTPADPTSPGCTLIAMDANHLQQEVTWTIRCDEARYLTIDATAFRGTADDHEIVAEQQVHEYVPAGASWEGTATFDEEHLDMIRAQAVTFVTPGDITEQPAIIGGATG